MASLQFRKKRSGFTFVELLVVLAIMAILLALLVPAVNRLRETASRAHCQNNLKQLALGIHNYEATNGVFPPAGRSYGWCRNPASFGDQQILNVNGWMEVLPFIEQEAIYRAYDPTKCMTNTIFGNEGCCGPCTAVGMLAGDAVGTGNGILATKQVQIFRCPSDPGNIRLRPSGIYSIKDGTLLEGVKTSYDFCVTATIECNYWRRHNGSSRRIFGENSNSRPGDIKDGSGSTILIAESTFEVYNGEANPWAYRGWVQPGVDPGLTVINDWTYGGITPQFGRLGSWGRMGSAHNGGAHAAFADGSVRFLNQDLSVATLNHLAAMDDGEVTPWVN